MPPTIMQVYCAWCGEFMYLKDGQGQEGVSHGICEKCYKKLLDKEVKQ